MGWESPKEAMPWVGLYVGVASLICTLVMAADAIQAIWQWKLWFPNKLFTLNASTITLIAIAMKLPVDLASELPGEGCGIYIVYTKMIGIYFLTVMLANFLPSLGLMDGKELLMNIVALGIFMITIAANIGIQIYTQVLFIYIDRLPLLILAFVLPFSVALAVSASREKLEHRYKESQRLVSSYQEKMFSSKGLRGYVKKYWMMTETRNPQFVIACSPVSSAFGVICLYASLFSGVQLVQFLLRRHSYGLYGCMQTDYNWSLDSCMERFQNAANTPNDNGSSEIKEYSVYVVQIEEDAKLSDRILRNTLRYITQLLRASEKKEPRNLMVLLEKSIGFDGVVEFENDQVQPLYQDETHNCWSLVLVTLTSIAIALPNIAHGHVKSLLSGMREGIQIVRNVEECLNGDSDTLETRKATKLMWAEVEVYHSWLHIDLRKTSILHIDSMAYIDKWRVLPRSQILGGGQTPYSGVASSTRIDPSSSSGTESLSQYYVDKTQMMVKHRHCRAQALRRVHFLNVCSPQHSVKNCNHW
ncbi:uncharacterized protein LOC143581715 [Bidens hawaiensis]|uniref:uncharacterized protein LOC143581715 n=1 Tax=Bidens hawaiensis TaxID=980011 RepID=UPI004049BD17